MKEEFKTVARYQYSAEAQIMKGRLEADGIQCFLPDVHTIDTDPLVSNAIGGVKLKVTEKDANAALEALESVSKFSVDNRGSEISCPRCSGSKVMLMSHVRSLKSLLFFTFSFFLTALPLNIKYDYHCNDCSFKFKLK